MYGTRPVAEGWRNECATAMAEIGFIVGSSSACAFYQPELYLASVVHGDDFITVGAEKLSGHLFGKA